MMMNTRPKILVVDDEKSMRDSMHMLLRDRYEVLLAENGRDAIKLVKQHTIDLVLLDIRLPEIDGLEVLRLIKGIDDSIEVIMVTAVITVGRAVEAIHAGAYDYLTKPFDIGALTEQVEKIIEKRALSKENVSLKRLIESDYQFERIVGKSQAIREVFRVIGDVANSNATVLITGESGTGKELVARAIHNRSPRQAKLFVALNCAAIPENLLESELFGHEKGSFTGAVERQIGKFEIASGGTIFLDEIGSLPLPMQAKILRVIQEKELERLGGSRPIPVDVRIIAASNANLREEIKQRRFREDLFYRINVIPIVLPPLRERREDIGLLAEHFLRKYNREFARKLPGFRKETLALLAAYDWPGNVRELENLVERLVVLTKSGQIGSEKLPPEIRGELACLPGANEVRLNSALKKFESEFIKQALEKAGGNKGDTAKQLGIHRNTLRNLEKKLKL
ncbi:MAG: sigma-54 dependent transcriptional regulator [Candidatus Margulisiibacteriota bacterium]